MIGDTKRLLWKNEELYGMVRALARRAGYTKTKAQIPKIEIDTKQIDNSVKRAARLVETEAHPAVVRYRSLEQDLHDLSPAVIEIKEEDDSFFLAVIECKKNRALCLDRNGRETKIDVAKIKHLLCHKLEQPYQPLLDSYSKMAGADEDESERISRAILGKMLEHEKTEGIWVIRGDSGQGLVRQIIDVGFQKKIVAVLLFYILQSGLMAFSWWLVAKNALDGKLEQGTLIAWGLLLITNVLITATASWWQGLLLLGINGLYKKKILHGATKLNHNKIKHLGNGHLFGQVMETESLDALAIGASLNLVMAIIDMLIVIGILFLIPQSLLLLGLYGCWLGIVTYNGVRLYLVQKRWTQTRIDMTNRIVECLIGRRTRIVQEQPAGWHDKDDSALEAYLEESAILDKKQASYEVIMNRGWLCLSLASLLPLLMDPGVSNGLIAAMIGAIIMSFKGLSSFTGSIQSVTSLFISWNQAKLLYKSSEEKEIQGLPEIIELEKKEARKKRKVGDVILEGSALSFHHEGRDEMVLSNASIEIEKGDRVLLEGPSGCGKSTLASILSGLMAPKGGVILLNGFDIRTLGEREWAKRVAFAPQFKDNHIFTGTLAFNLLMGRRWPASGADLKQADEVCRELDLGELLEKMPGGIHQTVGENGWKLSHGEQSRIFLARAILQDADVIILDESFGTLDPRTMKQCLETVFRRAPALITIAHP